MSDLPAAARIYRARWVLPIASAPIENGAVSVAAGRIEWVGPAAAAPTGTVVDLGNAALLPGLVNAHTHVELTALRGSLEDPGFRQWLLKLMKVRDHVMSPEVRLSSARLGIAEGLLNGITTYADVSDSGLSSHALESMGVRGVTYTEVFGPDPMQCEQSLHAVRKLIEETPRPSSGRVRCGLSPHAPYSVSDDLFRGAGELARKKNWPLATHIAESELETDLVVHAQGELANSLRARDIVVQPRARSPIALLDACGILSPDTLLIHAVRVDDEDIALMAARGSAVAHCPTANAKLGQGIAPLVRMRSAGLRVGLGSDSVAGNNRMDILGEARLAALLVRSTGRPGDQLDAREALRLATIGGAAALNLADEVGSLEVGKAADLCAFPLDDLADFPLVDIEAALIFGRGGRCASLTMVDGHELVRDGHLLADGGPDRLLVGQIASDYLMKSVREE